MLDATKAYRVFKSVVGAAVKNGRPESYCVPHTVGYIGMQYQFCCDGYRLYAIQAVIPAEKFEELRGNREYVPMNWEMPRQLFNEVIREGELVKTPTVKELREAKKLLKAEGETNVLTPIGGGIYVTPYQYEKGERPRPAIDLGAGKPKLLLDQLAEVLDLIPGARVYAGRHYPQVYIVSEDYMEHVIVMPLSYGGFTDRVRYE